MSQSQTPPGQPELAAGPPAAATTVRGRGGARGRGATSPIGGAPPAGATQPLPAAARGGTSPPRGRGRGGSPQPPNPQTSATPTDFSRRNSHQGSEASAPTPPLGAKSPAPTQGKKSPAPLQGKKSPSPLQGKKSPAPLAGSKGPKGPPPSMAGKKVPVPAAALHTQTPDGQAPQPGTTGGTGPSSTPVSANPTPGNGPTSSKVPTPARGVTPTNTADLQQRPPSSTNEEPQPPLPPSPPPSPPHEQPDYAPMPPSPPEAPMAAPVSAPPVKAPPKSTLQEKVTATCRVLIAIDAEITAGVDWKQNKLAVTITMNQRVKNILQAVQSKYRLDNILDVSIPVSTKGKDVSSLAPIPDAVIQLNLTPLQLGWRPDSYNWVWFRTKLPRDEGEPSLQQLTLKQFYLQRVQRVYEYYDPRKLNTSEAVLDDFEGSEDLLMVQLVGKYGPEPTPEQLRNKRVYNIGPASLKANSDATPQSILADNLVEKDKEAERRAMPSATKDGISGKSGGRKGDKGIIKRQARTENDRNRALEILLSRSSTTGAGRSGYYFQKWVRYIQVKRERMHLVEIVANRVWLSKLRAQFDLFKMYRIISMTNKQITTSAITAHKSDSLVGDLQSDNTFLKGEVKKLQTQVELLDSTNARRLETLCNSSELAINQIKALTLECQAKEQVISRLEKKLMGVGNMALAASEKKDYALQTAIAAHVEMEEKFRVATDRIAEIEHAYAQSQAEVRRLKKKSDLRKRLLSGHVPTEGELKTIGDSSEEEGNGIGVPVQKECRHCVHYARQKMVIDSHQRTNEELRNRVDELEKTLQKLQSVLGSCEEENATLRRDLRNASSASPVNAPASSSPREKDSSSKVSGNLAATDRGGAAGREAAAGKKDMPLANVPVPASIQAIIDSSGQKDFRKALSLAGPQPQVAMPPTDIPPQAQLLAPFQTYDGSTNPTWGYAKESAVPQLLNRSDPLPNNLSAPPRMLDYYKAEASRQAAQGPLTVGFASAPTTAETIMAVAPRVGHSDLAGRDLSLQKFFAVDAAVGQERIMLQIDRQLNTPRVGLLPHERDRLVKEREMERRALLNQSMNGAGGAFAADFMQAKSLIASNANAGMGAQSNGGQGGGVATHHNSGQYRVTRTEDRLGHHDPNALKSSFKGYEAMLRQGDSSYTTRQPAADVLGSATAGAGERPRLVAGDRYKYNTVPISSGLKPMKDRIFSTNSVLPPSTR